MSENTKPWENDSGPTQTPPAPPTDEELLVAAKATADELGITYAANIGLATLQERIAEALNTPVETPPPAPDINALKRDEKVSKAERQASKASIDYSKQAPLEVINMVSQGMSVKEARKKHAEAGAIRAAREAERRGEVDDQEVEK